MSIVMEIVLAAPKDLDAIGALMEACKQQMAREGIHQWEADYPNHTDLVADIETQTAYIAIIGGAL